jgi:hypothetical protein
MILREKIEKRLKGLNALMSKEGLTERGRTFSIIINLEWVLEQIDKMNCENCRFEYCNRSVCTGLNSVCEQNDRDVNFCSNFEEAVNDMESRG